VQHAPHNAMEDPGDIARFHDRCSDLMRELLSELAGAPDRPRTFPDVEDLLGWPRRRLASVLGGVAHLRNTEFGGRRPYRLQGERASASGRWEIWMDAGQARAVRHAAYSGSMSEENVRRTGDFIAAYNRRDFDAAVQYFDPEIDWVLPEHQRSDSCRGPEEIRRFWEGLDETFEELRLDPQEFVDAGERVAVRLRFYGRGRGSGAELDTEMYHQVTTFQDGTMVRIEYFDAWGEALDAARATG
jgi:ketosteroid isomerase-like protein